MIALLLWLWHLLLRPDKKQDSGNYYKQRDGPSYDGKRHGKVDAIFSNSYDKIYEFLKAVYMMLKIVKVILEIFKY